MSYDSSYLIMETLRPNYKGLDTEQTLTLTKSQWQSLRTNGTEVAKWTDTQLDAALADDGSLGKSTNSNGDLYNCIVTA